MSLSEALILLVWAGACFFAFGWIAWWVTMIVVGTLWSELEIGILAFAGVGFFVGGFCGVLFAMTHVPTITFGGF